MMIVNEGPLLAQGGRSVSKLPIGQPFPASGATGGWGFDTRHDGPNYEILAGEWIGHAGCDDEPGAVRPDEHDLANISRCKRAPKLQSTAYVAPMNCASGPSR